MSTATMESFGTFSESDPPSTTDVPNIIITPPPSENTPLIKLPAATSPWDPAYLSPPLPLANPIPTAKLPDTSRNFRPPSPINNLYYNPWGPSPSPTWEYDGDQIVRGAQGSRSPSSSGRDHEAQAFRGALGAHSPSARSTRSNTPLLHPRSKTSLLHKLRRFLEAFAVLVVAVLLLIGMMFLITDLHVNRGVGDRIPRIKPERRDGNGTVVGGGRHHPHWHLGWHRGYKGELSGR